MTRRPVAAAGGPGVVAQRMTPAQTPPAARSRAALVHELEVHQIELEMQNEELRKAQIELAAARDVYEHLYDFAPVGYFTLDPLGVIVAANLAGAALLAEDRKNLLGRKLAEYMVAGDRPKWQRRLRELAQGGPALQVELMLLPRKRAAFHGQLDCLRVKPAGAPSQLRLTVSDISWRKAAEMDRRIATSGQDAREEERRQLSFELHEDLAQRLIAVRIDLSVLAALDDPQARKVRTAAALRVLDDALERIRRMATELRPRILDELGFNAALEWLANDMRQRLGLTVRLHLQPRDPPLDQRAALALFRMVQEALEQLAGLSQTRQVGLGVSNLADAVVLRLQALDMSDAVAHAFGAAGKVGQALLDRAHLAGAALAIDSVPELGMRMTVRMPLDFGAGGAGPV